MLDTNEDILYKIIRIYTAVGLLKMSRSDAHAFAMIKMHANAPKNIV